MADKSVQKKSHKKDKKEGDKDPSEKVTVEKPEKSKKKQSLSKEKTPETPVKKKIKTQKLKSAIIFQTILLLLLVGALSWTIYYLHNTIQNNLVINSKIKETVEEVYRIKAEQDKIKETIKSFENNGIDRIQAEQDKIKGTIESFQSNRDDLEKLLMDVNKLTTELSGLQDEVKVLQVEINNKPDFMPPSEVQVDIPSPPNQPEKLEIEKEAEIKIEGSVLVEKPEVEKMPKLEEEAEEVIVEVKKEATLKKESPKDVREKVIHSIEDTAGTIVQKTGNALKWVKEKIF